MLASYGGVHGFYSPSRPCRPGVDADGWDYSISWSSRTDWYPKSSKRTHVRRRRWVRPKSVVSLKGNPRVDWSNLSLSLSLSYTHTHTLTIWSLVACRTISGAPLHRCPSGPVQCVRWQVFETRGDPHLMMICYLFSFLSFLSLALYPFCMASSLASFNLSWPPLLFFFLNMSQFSFWCPHCVCVCVCVCAGESFMDHIV